METIFLRVWHQKQTLEVMEYALEPSLEHGASSVTPDRTESATYKLKLNLCVTIFVGKNGASGSFGRIERKKSGKK